MDGVGLLLCGGKGLLTHRCPPGHHEGSGSGLHSVLQQKGSEYSLEGLAREAAASGLDTSALPGVPSAGGSSYVAIPLESLVPLFAPG